MVAEVRGERLSTSDAAKKYKVNNEYVDALMEYLDTAGIIRYHDLVDNAAKLIDVSLAKNEFIEQLFNYKVVVVDEFQDMYQGLMTIIEKVVKYPTRGHALNTTKHLCIAGDPNQSIYEFLGSKPEMMKVIEHHFPEFPEFTVKHSVIKESFRCTPEVLKCAVEVCVPQSDVLSRSIHSVKESSHPPVIKEFKSPSEEYQFIIQEIIRLCCESGGMFKLSDFAVLARSNKEIEDFGSILANNYGIKSNKLNSSLSWIKSKVQIMLSLLNALERTSGSELPLLCILMFLDTEFGSKARISKIFSLSRTWGREEGLKTDSLEDYLIANSIGNVRKGFAIETVYKTSRHKKIIKRFNTFLESIGTQRQQLAQNYASQTPEMVLQSLLFMIENSVLKDYLNTPTGIKKSTNEADLDALRLSYTKELNEHLKEFELSLKSSYSHYQSKGVLEATGDSFVKHFLRNYNEEVLNNSPDTVNISTIHASKGLEFPIVFVIGTSPYTRGSWDALLTSDEHTSSSMARLLYVAMTRAKNLVYLGSAEVFQTKADLMKAFIY
ncbi:P-loop containing nucleoside triphosphate hydrolase protein [Yamadazyma tenuis ATCC 10573]|uniref:DNA 3'-5' helicase n=1 Tax=Candida tenuis (strain ATCC 10573 / BCRC 21748 / CBS 615 / JCM 9827 / NBRC 10315 / NRRL Y-1498 / VKM Y-70) TaxID=590646 RepID=G3B709_CANTC|nr:P-loop containing nucleoside triphosphate hydrolase protein [Yamadazyma tenuis ATCC 10573]EGV63069.1 P-loop containing nucleoside triphosphate hydrolase protein [Yamadazyma tenuis ATCC 10573]